MALPGESCRFKPYARYGRVTLHQATGTDFFHTISSFVDGFKMCSVASLVGTHACYMTWRFQCLGNSCPPGIFTHCNSLELTGNGENKEKKHPATPESYVTEKHHVNERGQRRMARLVKANGKDAGERQRCARRHPATLGLVVVLE